MALGTARVNSPSMGHAPRTRIDRDSLSQSWGPRSVIRALTNVSSWDLARARMAAAFSPVLCEHESGSLVGR